MQNSIGGIFHCMQTLLSQNDILRKAALALCMSTIVWQDNQADMRQSGRRYYFEALHGMAKALGQYAGDGGLALLATTRLFGFYEVSKTVNSMTSHNIFYSTDDDRQSMELTKALVPLKYGAGWHTMPGAWPSFEEVIPAFMLKD